MEFGSVEHLALHAEHSRRVLLALRYADLRVSGTKCDWGTDHFKLLGYMINTRSNEIEMDAKRAAALIDYPKPATLSDVQIYLAILNYWARFLPRFRQIAYPLARMLRTKIFVWDEAPMMDKKVLECVERTIYSHGSAAGYFS